MDFEPFVNTYGDKIKCQLCGKILAFHGGASDLREHLLAAM